MGEAVTNSPTKRPYQPGLFDKPVNQAYEDYLAAYSRAYRLAGSIAGRLVESEQQRTMHLNGGASGKKKHIKPGTKRYEKYLADCTARLLALVEQLDAALTTFNH